MEENIKGQIDASDAISEFDSRKVISTPIKSLNATMEFVGNVYSKYGASEYHPAQLFADANELAVNSIKQLLSTAQQYGFLKKSHGIGYKITPLFTTIFHPVDENEKYSAIIDSLRSVPLYTNLLSNYENQVVPSIPGLVNMFVRNAGMKANIAQKAAEIFTQNLRDYDLLSGRNVLILKPKYASSTIQNAITNTQIIDSIESSKNSEIAVPAVKLEDEDEKSMIKVPIKLKNKRMAYLSFPEEYDEQDLKRILKVIHAYADIYSNDDDDNLL